MSTKLKINYLRQSELPDVGIITKLIVSSDRVIDIKCHNTGGQIFNQRYDFSSAVSRPESHQSPNGYSDLVYRYFIEDDELTIWVACVVPNDTDLPNPDYQEYTVESFPTTIFLGEGIEDGSEAITNTPSWVTDLSVLSYVEKRKIELAEIRAWRTQKETWLETANKFVDLNPDIAKHMGYWLRSADRVIQKFSQDPDIDPLIVAEIAKQASQGPSAYDPDNPAMLFRNLLPVITTYPNGPDFSAIWVETRDLASPSDVERKTILEVLQSRGTDADETYDLPADYDSTQDDWIVANQPGIVSYDNDSPVSGDTITATLEDYDGGVTNRRYRWQEQGTDGSWSNMSGSQNRQRAWTTSTAGTYRCRVLYDDNYASGQEAFGPAFIIT